MVRERCPKLANLKLEVAYSAFLIFGACLCLTLPLACRQPRLDGLAASVVRASKLAVGLGLPRATLPGHKLPQRLGVSLRSAFRLLLEAHQVGLRRPQFVLPLVCVQAGRIHGEPDSLPPLSAARSALLKGPPLLGPGTSTAR